MSTKATTLLLVLMTALAFAVGAYVYPSLPDHVASHWNSAGEVNGYMPKFWGVFLVPLMMLAFIGLYFALPALDPKRGIHAFRKYYNIFWIAFFIFFVYIFKLVVMYNYAGEHFDLNHVMPPAVAFLYLVIGWILPRTKQNWFMGIRTPWTLSSEKVWDKTHKLGGILFSLSALGPALLFFMPGAGDIPTLVLLVGPILLAAIITVVYSYIEFKREAR